MIYQVRLEKFEGPMELLLELIEKEKLSITELSLAKVADQYLEFIRDNQNIHLENLAEFLSVASRLILIKSRSLLPMLKLEKEEEEEIEDLERQLEEYKRFKEASMALGKMAEKRTIGYSREGYQGVRSIFYPPEDFNIFDFKKYFQIVLEGIPAFEKLQEEVVREIVTLEERINEIENSLRQRMETSFAELVERSADKIDVIVSFLAMLEMVKQRIVQVEQEGLFEDIKISVKRSQG